MISISVFIDSTMWLGKPLSLVFDFCIQIVSSLFALLCTDPGNWWSQFEAPVFQRLVELYKVVVVYLLKMHKVGVPHSEQRVFTCFLDTALKLLEILHAVSVHTQITYAGFTLWGRAVWRESSNTVEEQSFSHYS